MADALAQYVLQLSEALTHTHYAADRPLYEKYLAHAAVLLALVVKGAERTRLDSEVKTHESLWGHTWLQDPVYRAPAEAFKSFKELLSRE